MCFSTILIEMPMAAATGQQAEQRFLGEVVGGVGVRQAPEHVGEQVGMQQVAWSKRALPAAGSSRTRQGVVWCTRV